MLANQATPKLREQARSYKPAEAVAWVYKKAPLPKQRGFPVHLQRVAALLVPGTVAVLILDPGGQAHLIEQRQERLGRQLFDVDHALGIPLTTGHQ